MNQVEVMATQTKTRQDTPADFVRHGITVLFNDLAETVDRDGIEVGPLEIFKAQTWMLKCWDLYLEEQQKDKQT